MAGTKPKILIVFYSTWGHCFTLAKKIKEGVDEAGAEGLLYQIAETLPEAVLEKMHAAPHPFPDIPIITGEDLKSAEGILFGFPTRYGGAPAQVRAFFDSTGGLWQAGALIGKPVGIFFGTGTQGGGQETTALTTIPFFVHHGMIFVPLGYTNQRLGELDVPHGGSAYGAGYLSGGDGSRAVSELELEVGKHHGKYFAGVVKVMVAGKAALA